ncbi:MAG: hypothetical protein HRU19_16175 [Pseudobacteriovorax sp.]|nr:hypothetical protein [Pseudobacteriovorax sp.]
MKKLLTILLLCTSGSSFALQGSTGKITRLDQLADGDIRIQIDSEKCVAANGHYLLKDSHPNKKEIYSTLLAASMSGKSVVLTGETCERGSRVSIISRTSITY